MARTRDRSPRRVLCTYCDLPIEVAAEAKSVSCRHCNRRVVTEALTVKDYVAVRRFATANTMRITRKGIVIAAVRAEALEVEGRLEGSAIALGPIRLRKKALVKADLRGTALSMDPTVTLVGEMRIGPGQVPELKRLAVVPATEG